MRFLVCLRPFFGHLHPIAPTARALERAGHEVVVASAEAFRDAVEREGFQFAPAGHDPRAPLPECQGGQGGVDWSETVTRKKLDDLLALAAYTTPDVVVRDQTDFAGVLAAELLGVPCATLGPALFIPPPSWRTIHGRRLDRIRAAYGLAPDPRFDRLHPYLYLDVAPPSWQLPEAIQIDVLHSIRPVDLPPGGGGEWCPPPTNGRPLAYVTLGTVYNRRPVLLRALIQGAAAAGLAVVATTGFDQDPASLGVDDLPHVQVRRWLPQLDVLQHCSLVIAHGGFSTVMGALANGLPLVVVPLGSDNPVHARRCRQLGVGVTIPPGRVDAEAVRDAAGSVLQEPQWREQARRLRDEIRGLPGPEHAAALLVRLAENREPVVAPGRGRLTRQRLDERTAVVIPVLGRPDLVYALLRDIAREPDASPVIVDNGGDYEPLGTERVLHPGENLGWAGGCNFALRELADADYDAFVLLNSDTRLGPDFFAGLWQAWRVTQAWILGPVYDGVWPCQRVKHDDIAATYRPRPVHRPVLFLDGTCLFLPRVTVAAIGLLDANSFPRHGWGVDFDYALRTRRAGGTICATELSYLHHEGGGTASLQAEGWKLRAWEEMVCGMRRKWGQAWPNLLRMPESATAEEFAPRDFSAANTCVLVLGAPRSGSSLVTRLVNLLGVAPLPRNAEQELDRINTRLFDRNGRHPPADSFELLAPPLAIDALGDARDAWRSLAPHRPFLWRDPRNDFLLPFWAAALDVRTVAILVLRHPLEVGDSLAARLGCSRANALAYWERSLRHALANLVGLPVLVTRFVDVLDDPIGWSDRAEEFLGGAGLPLVVSSDRRVLAEAVSPELRRRRADGTEGLSPEQRSLAALADQLVGAHHVFPDVTLPPETPDLDVDLAPGDGHPIGGRVSRLTQTWAEWVFENRRKGVRDSELVKVLVEQGIAPAEARREIALLEHGWQEPGYRLVNRARWNELVAMGAPYTLPWGPPEFAWAREILDDPLPLPWREIETVLCLASGGGQQAPLFAALDKRVTVFDLSPAQLRRDREVAEAYGLSLEYVEGDMLDLHELYGRRFDLVYQPVSTCYVDDLPRLRREVRGVLRPGGWYWSEHWNPVHMQLEGLGYWCGWGYRIVRHQHARGPVVFSDQEGAELPGACWQFIHSLEALIGGLGEAGFVVGGFAERLRGDASAPPGSDDHACAFVPPLLAVLAQLDPGRATGLELP
jgi:UDP:flavonoid glycosyltransferase YjiC (YdhE family)/SAM-dependent methyltransferase